MPLETIGSYAVAGSTGAIARGARQSYVPQYDDAANDSVFAASSARGGITGGEEVKLPTSTSSVAVYLSPFIRFDLQSRLAIVEFRDSQTGTVERQYPSPRVVEEYRQNLPESSDLQPRAAPSQAASQQELQPRIIGAGGEIDTSGKPVAGGNSGQQTSTPASSNTAAPSPAPAAVAHAATAAFGAAQSAVQTSAAPSRELAVA